MKPEDFELFATLVKQRSGLVLTREKAYLLESRLLPVARKYNLKSLEDMAQSIRGKRDDVMLQSITDAMTTNETWFFRDRKPFEYFRTTLLPRLLTARVAKKQVRIWSAAASSGQEAYSFAMLCADEAEKLAGWKVEILGTDISQEMIERAKSGIYTQFEMQRGLPILMLLKHFQQLGGDKWQIKDALRENVTFCEGNLLHDFGPIGSFDVVVCRNVLGYFDGPTRARVLNALAQIMQPEGALILGKGESTVGITERFKPDSGDGFFVLSSSSAAGAARHAAI